MSRGLRNAGLSGPAIRTGLPIGLWTWRQYDAETKVKILKWIAAGVFVVQTVVIVGGLVVLARFLAR